MLYWINHNEKYWWLWKYSLCKSFVSDYWCIDWYIEEKNGNKYLIFASTDKNKELLEQRTIAHRTLG